MSTTISLRRADGEKNSSRGIAASPSNELERIAPAGPGGGRSMASALSAVAANAGCDAVGNRFGTGRSVNEAMPASTCGSRARSAIAARRARAYRVGASTDSDASIDRDVSTTNHASASARTRRGARELATGCAAAAPTSTPSATIAPAGERDPARRRAQPEQPRDAVGAPRGEEQRGERDRGGQPDEPGPRRCEGDGQHQ